jgi:hypothetical protein
MRFLASATVSFRRIMAIEFSTCRSGLIGRKGRNQNLIDIGLEPDAVDFRIQVGVCAFPGDKIGVQRV